MKRSESCIDLEEFEKVDCPEMRDLAKDFSRCPRCKGDDEIWTNFKKIGKELVEEVVVCTRCKIFWEPPAYEKVNYLVERGTS